MKYSKVYLTDADGNVISLRNEFYNMNQLQDALEDSNSIEELLKKLFFTEHSSNSFVLDRDSSETVRIKCIGEGFWITTIRFLVIKKQEAFTSCVRVV